jgi:hypothetical protein
MARLRGNDGHKATSHCLPAPAIPRFTRSVDTRLRRQKLTVAADSELWAAKAIAQYSTCLPSGAIEPDLEFFAKYYLDAAGSYRPFVVQS